MKWSRNGLPNSHWHLCKLACVVQKSQDLCCGESMTNLLERRFTLARPLKCGCLLCKSVECNRKVGFSVDNLTLQGVFLLFQPTMITIKKVLEMHLKEHQAAIRRGETEKSAVAEHTWSRHHQLSGRRRGSLTVQATSLPC